jgi:hypothetical protein
MRVARASCRSFKLKAMSSFERKAWAVVAVVWCAFLSGCGTPGAPQPPSLNLADPVEDLSAKRTGNRVELTWTMPRRNTDKTALKADVSSRICRREENGSCNPLGSDLIVASGNLGNYTDALPGSLTSGEPRPVSYFVELRNKKGRSAGLSNAATVLAGEAPRPVEGLKAEVRKQGVVLSWIADGEKAAVRLDRKLLSPPQTKAEHGLLAPAPEPINETLLVDEGVGQGRAIDKTIHVGQSYEYRAQRVRRVDVDGKTLELTGEPSQAIDVDAVDVFPPEVPAGLAAVAAAGETGSGPTIDLSWQPDTEAELAGYVVYRREGGGEWQRISPVTPGVEPAFHDAQVQPGHRYEYAVSAVGKNGRESGRSAAAQERVPES